MCSSRSAWQLPLVICHLSRLSGKYHTKALHPLMALQRNPHHQCLRTLFSHCLPSRTSQNGCLSTPHLSRYISASLTLSDSVGARGKIKSRLVTPRQVKPVPEKRKVKEKEVVVIDETGKSLGEMESDVAIRIAEGQGLEIVQLRKATKNSKAVYKFASKKQLYEEKKIHKQLHKKDPQQIVKEIPISTKIGQHDLEVKVYRITQFLEKKHTVRVIIEGHFRKFFTESQNAAERKQQAGLLKDVAQRLEGVGSKVNKETQQGRKLFCNFKPVTGPQDKD